MRKTDVTQHSLYSYRTLEERIPNAHSLRKLRVLVDAILANMNDDFQALYSRCGRPSIAPERLLRASLIQTLFSIRSERQLADSTAKRPPIPRQSGHRFHGNLATDSTPIRPPTPRESGHRFHGKPATLLWTGRKDLN